MTIRSRYFLVCVPALRLLRTGCAYIPTVLRRRQVWTSRDQKVDETAPGLLVTLPKCMSSANRARFCKLNGMNKLRNHTVAKRCFRSHLLPKYGQQPRRKIEDLSLIHI